MSALAEASTSSREEPSAEPSRKRTFSISQDEESDRKRPRVLESFLNLREELIHGTPIPPRVLRARPSNPGDAPTLRHRASLSRASSSALLSRPSTPSPSVRSNSPAVSSFPDTSAKFNLRNSKVAVDFHGADETAWPASWSSTNLLVFGRGNRVHVKDLSAPTSAVSGLLKLKDDQGHLRLLECGGGSVALATSTGLVEVWDVAARRATASWRTKPATAMRWAGPVLTVGTEKGAISHFDTRVKEAGKTKDQARKMFRHQAPIGVLAWNHDGRVLASGDDSGVIYCWDSRQNAPLDVGDLIQRRRKMQHVGAVKALAWCPWSLKVLASGDAAANGTGTIRLWNVNTSSTKPPVPDALDLDAQITSLQWSTQCKELLSTHGISRIIDDDAASPLTTPLSASAPPPTLANAIAVHTYPNLSHVTTLYPATTPLAGSILSPNGQRIALAVPGEKQLRIWEVWGKRKEIRKQRSVVDLEGPWGIR